MRNPIYNGIDDYERDEAYKEAVRAEREISEKERKMEDFVNSQKETPC